MRPLKLTRLACSLQLRRPHQQDPGELEQLAHAARSHAADVPSQCALILPLVACSPDLNPVIIPTLPLNLTTRLPLTLS